jgi:hypothetical protein
MAKNHESVLWVVEFYTLTSKVFRTRSAARAYHDKYGGRRVVKAEWGPDNIKAKAK